MSPFYRNRKRFKLLYYKNSNEYIKLMENFRALGYNISRSTRSHDLYGISVNISNRTVKAHLTRQGWEAHPALGIAAGPLRKLLYLKERILPEETHKKPDAHCDSPVVLQDVFVVVQDGVIIHRPTKQTALALAKTRAQERPNHPVQICELHVVGTVSTEIKIDFDISS